ncbi:hypothetical protein SAMD00019534_018730 [Acytostelium subglobosum LB1]|uniref:hypothetical protein n=1 Tax=Acytostelium subglobosum LB1 TaxID=1410327 RepID=UPI00064509A2|nr:hypothetical protein SAMD00019534_018730 [Acytostelium subglobosum LB1]GAM18698.1 hypothetical protein SAMD00019534_018730 [Acytostelium subglobosum LB1]|eukprot:XP_012757918.1 hypothetical protein SAMD00019534_018730 [Acytostelium subglobosum LB1]
MSNNNNNNNNDDKGIRTRTKEKKEQALAQPSTEDIQRELEKLMSSSKQPIDSVFQELATLTKGLSQTDIKQKELKGQQGAIPPRKAQITRFMAERESLVNMPGFSTFVTTTTQSSITKPVPCTQDVMELTPMRMRDMFVETVHKGKVLILRTICPPYKVNAISLLVIDQYGGDEAHYLIVYNFVVPGAAGGDKGFKHLDLAFPGTVLALKEPYLKYAKSGQIVIRVDDPIEIEKIDDPNHPLIFNTEWKVSMLSNIPKDLDGWRLRGNDQYNAGRFDQALASYNQGLALDPQHSVLSHNKMAALLALKHYHECILLGLKLVEITPENEKLLLRLARCYYELGLYDLSNERYSQVIKIAPKNNDAKSGVQKCTTRLSELREANYNYKKIRETLSPEGHADCAEYIGPIKIIDTPDMGRGLVLTQDVPAGTLLIASRAVGYFKGQPTDELPYMDMSAKIMLKNSDLKIASLSVLQAKANPCISKRLSLLYYGKEAISADNTPLDVFMPPTTISFEGAPVIGQELAKRITQFNAFTADDYENIQANTMSKIVGLWPLPSLLNHSCIYNVSRFFIGDFMFIYSNSNLTAGQQLFSCYMDNGQEYAERCETLKNGFSIDKCSCQLCEWDRAENPDSVKQRQKLAASFDQYRDRIKNRDLTVINQLSSLCNLIHSTYKPDRPFFHSAMFLTGTALGMMCGAGKYEKGMEVYIECVKSTGFDPSLLDMTVPKSPEAKKKQKQMATKTFELETRGRMAMINYTHIDLFIHIAEYAYNLGRFTLARQCVALSRFAGLITHGLDPVSYKKFFNGKNFNPDLFTFTDKVSFK